MNVKLFQVLFTFFTLANFVGTYGQIDNIPSLSIQTEPSSGKIGPGGTAKISCSINGNQNKTHVLWSRRIGDIEYQIGSDSILSYMEWSRYTLSLTSSGTNVATFTLTITGVILEDSATFVCTLLSNPSVKTSAALVICDDVSSKFCDCMLGKGWASPVCYSDLELNGSGYDQNRSALIGLGVSLLITTIYVIIIGMVYSRDYLQHLHHKRQEKSRRDRALFDKTRSKSPGEVLGKPVYNDADHIQLDPSDSSSDTVDTVASSANGNGSEELSESSGYHGSNSSRSASSRIGLDVTKKVRTEIVHQPEIYSNQEYVQDRNEVSQKKAQKLPRISNISAHVQEQDSMPYSSPREVHESYGAHPNVPVTFPSNHGIEI